MTNAEALARVETKVKRIQEILGVTADGWPGNETESAYKFLRKLAAEVPDGEWGAPQGYLSSFADPADVAAFNACKSQGKSDQECFKVGDNGIGCWGDNTAQDQVAMCALPPEDMIERWGSIGNAKHKPVVVRANGLECVCVLADRMPSKANITNGAICDLNPGAAKRLNLIPPFKVKGSWTWG